MLSMPPATTTLAEPALMASAASMTAFMAEPHTLLSVAAPVEMGRPALMAACRAGACPWPAVSTLPKMTSSTCCGCSPAFSTAALMATPPRSLADSGVKSPWKLPIGVRVAETMTMVSLMRESPFRYLQNAAWAGARAAWNLSATGSGGMAMRGANRFSPGIVTVFEARLPAKHQAKRQALAAAHTGSVAGRRGKSAPRLRRSSWSRPGP